MIVLFTCGPMFAYSMLSVGRLGGKRFVRVIDVKQNPTGSLPPSSYATCCGDILLLKCKYKYKYKYTNSNANAIRFQSLLIAALSCQSGITII